jgi:hypothetical protein
MEPGAALPAGATVYSWRQPSVRFHQLELTLSSAPIQNTSMCSGYQECAEMAGFALPAGAMAYGCCQPPPGLHQVELTLPSSPIQNTSM